MNKDVLAFIYLVSTFVVDEFTTVNNKTTRIGEKRHRSQCESSVMAVQSRRPRLHAFIVLKHSLLAVDVPKSEILLSLYNLDPIPGQTDSS